MRERETLARRLKELDTILGRQDSMRELVQSALSKLDKAGDLFSTLEIHEKRELASVLEVKATISHVPGGTVLSVTVLGGDPRERSFERVSIPKAKRPCGALWAVAKGLLQGLTTREIADARKVGYETVRQQVRAIMKIGGGSLESGLAILEPLARLTEVSTSGRKPRPALVTAHEIRVLDEVARGMCNQETAEHLGLSQRSVKDARARVNRKFGTHGWQTVVEARRRGLIAGPRSECKITVQEQFVLERLAQRAKTREIAKDLSLGREAFKSIIKRLRRKLGARDLRELVEKAISRGLVNP